MLKLVREPKPRFWRSGWLRVNWTPWGRVLHWHEQQYLLYRSLKDDGDLAVVKIQKCFDQGQGPGWRTLKRIKFYLFTDRNGRIHRSRQYAKIYKIAKRELDSQLKEGHLQHLTRLANQQRERQLELAQLLL